MIDSDNNPNWPHWLNWLLAALGLVALAAARIQSIGRGIAAVWRWFVRRFNAMADLAEAITKLSNSFEALVKVTESRFSVVEANLEETRRNTAIAHAQAALLLDEDETPRFRCRLPEGTCDWVNPALAKLFKRETHAMMVWEWLSAIHPDDIQRVQSEWLTCIRAGTPYRTRYRILVEEEPRWVEASGRIVKDDKEQPFAVLGRVMPVLVHN